MNGIHHGDISLKNLMYAISKDGDPLGIVNDFDLATWVGHSTTNSDRTGTIPFMAIDLLNGGLDRCIPRLYRHDLESFCWVLAYVTVAEIKYGPHTIDISPPKGFTAWFQDSNQDEREAHVTSKQALHNKYSLVVLVPDRYFDYSGTIQRIIRYWTSFHESLGERTHKTRSRGPYTLEPVREAQVPGEPEIDDPSGSLGLFVDKVNESLKGVGFTGVKALLLEAIETPVRVSAAEPRTLT